MAFPSGALSHYFQSSEAAEPVVNTTLQQELVSATRGLVRYYFPNTVFARGVLDLAFVREVPSHTIFSRRDRGSVPYLLTDLASDLRKGDVSRLTIDEPTEAAIRSLVGTLTTISNTSLPVMVEDSSSQHYLILEGNKRFTAAALADPDAVLPKLEAYVGRSTFSFRQMLRLHSMEPAA